jgi:hypothetical protein
VIKRRVVVPPQVRWNPAAQETELALALALDRKEGSIPRTGFPVFAYLPVQSYGLTFLLQGDWILASGRESLKVDATWNLWLRDEVPPLFLETVDKAKQSVSPLSIQLVLDAVPLPSEVSSFFKPAAAEIARRLQGCPCLPPEDGNWAVPSNVVVDEQAWEFFSSDFLDKYLHKVFLSHVCGIPPPAIPSLAVPTPPSPL